MCHSPRATGLMPQVRSAHGCGDEQRSQGIRQKLPARSVQPHNALTLSCKNRPPSRPPGSGAAAAATNNAVAGANCSRRDAGVQFGAARRRLRRRAKARLFLSACEGSWAAPAIRISREEARDAPEVADRLISSQRYLRSHRNAPPESNSQS